MDSTNACGDFGVNGDISMIFFGIPVTVNGHRESDVRIKYRGPLVIKLMVKLQ